MRATVGAALALLSAILFPLFLGLWLWAVPAGAQGDGRSVAAQRYDADLAVQQGGDVLVRETLQIAFQGGPFTQGYRRIPLARLEGVSDVQVEQTAPEAVTLRRGDGQAYTYALSGQTQGGGTGSGDLRIDWWFPPTTNAVRTFVISYRAQGAVRYYDGGDQLYWDVTGNDRPYPVRSSTVTLRLPPGVNVAQNQWLTDLYPRRFLQSTTVGADGSVTWQAGGIPASEAFEVRAQWPHGLVQGSPPSWQQAADEQDRLRQTLAPYFIWLAAVGSLIVSLLGGLWLLVRWVTRGRDPAVGKVPPELDAPPSDLPPALVGTVVDEHADAQDVVATVLDLAARGEIAIREITNSTILGGQHDFELELLRDRKAVDPTLRPYERMVLDSFFTRGPKVRLSELSGWWQYAVPRVEAGLHSEVKAAGLFYDDPERVRARYRRLGLFLAIAGLLLGLATCGLAPEYATPLMWPFFCLAGIGLLLRYVAPRMVKRTAAGAVEAARWRAYARYLMRQPVDQLALPGAGRSALPAGKGAGADGLAGPEPAGRPEPAGPAPSGAVFERTLPYAVALGLAKQWVDKFAEAGTPAPRWLQPPVVVMPGPTWGVPVGPYGPYRRWGRRGRRYPGYPGPYGPGYPGVPAPGPNGRGGGPPNGSGGDGGGGGGGLQDLSDSTAGGLERASGSLADLLQAASEVLSKGGSGRWSGGGRGGGGWSSGGGFGGGGGGSGGGGSGFS